MPCEPISIGGARGFACGRGSSTKCSTIGCERRARYLCDYVIQPNGSMKDLEAQAKRIEQGAKGLEAATCSRPLCERCATNVLAKDRHVCPPHAKVLARRAR